MEFDVLAQKIEIRHAVGIAIQDKSPRIAHAVSWFARLAPERTAGLFFFDFIYPGLGSRMSAPDSLKEIWYQSFNQMPMAPALVAPTARPAKHTLATSFATGPGAKRCLTMSSTSSSTTS